METTAGNLTGRRAGNSPLRHTFTAAGDLDHPYANLVREVPFRPIFIIGDHRTGTTILYKMLGATGCFNIVTAYHLICYNELVHNHLHGLTEERKGELAALFARKGLTDRGIDGVPAGPDTPEEYGFILRNGGYRPQLRPDNLADLITLCRKVQFTAAPDRLLLLKNPWDFLNFMYVKEVFPDSRFIFIHRNPINTVNSQLKATRSLLQTRNAYVALVVPWYAEIFHQPIRLRLARLMFSSRFGLGLRVVIRHVARATSYFLQHIPSLSATDYVSVRYEDLCSDPRRTITGILDTLALEAKAEVAYESLVRVRKSTLLEEVQRHRQAIFARMRPYFERWGYTANEVST